MKILFLSSEMAPFAKSGGLGDVVGALPRALRQAGHDARVILPLYKKIKDKYHEKLEFKRWAMLKLGWRTMYSGLFEMDFDGLPVYFIDNEYYFGHENIYIDYDFDIERFSFYQRAVLECLGEPMGFQPYVATVDKDGNPNIGPKRTARILDDEHIIYNENTGGQTMRNLEDNGKIAIAYVNYEKLDGYRFVGTAEVYHEGPYMEQALAWTAEHKKGNPKAAVVMKIERIFTLKIGKLAGTEITDAE